MPSRSAIVVGWLTVTAVATTVGMGTVAVVRGAVGEPSSVVTLSQSEIAGQDRAAPIGSAGPSTDATPDPTTSTGPSVHPTRSPPAGGGHSSEGPRPSTRPSSGPSSHPSTEPSQQPSQTPTTGPSTGGGSSPVFRSLVSPGGSILAKCTGAVVRVVSASPSQGYRVLIESDGGQQAEVKFLGSTEVGVQIVCVKGVPTQSVETSDSGASDY